MHESNVTIAWINKEVLQRIYGEANEKSPFETGGCLLGYWDSSFKEVVIEKCTDSGANAKHSKYSFKPDGEWQETQIASIYEESGRLCTYLGDWHSHPNGILILSWKDKWTLLRIANYLPARAPHPLMLLVAGSPWQMRIWKVVKARWFFFNADMSECEVRVYS